MEWEKEFPPTAQNDLVRNEALSSSIIFCQEKKHVLIHGLVF